MDGMYNIFLSFTSPEFRTPTTALDYFAFRSSDANLYLLMWISIVGGVFVFYRLRYEEFSEYTTHPAYMLHLLCSVLCFACIIKVVFNRLALFSYKTDFRLMQRFHESRLRIFRNSTWCMSEDLVLLFSTLSACFNHLSTALIDEGIDSGHDRLRELDSTGP